MADATLAHVPADVSDEEALLLGDIFSTGFFAADNAGIAALATSYGAASNGAGGSAGGGGAAGAGVAAAAAAGGQQSSHASGREAGPVVAVVGCGPVGVLACIGVRSGMRAWTLFQDGWVFACYHGRLRLPQSICCARHAVHAVWLSCRACTLPAGARGLGAARVFAIDSVPERLALAARFGAEPLNREQCDPQEAIRWVGAMVGWWLPPWSAPACRVRLLSCGLVCHCVHAMLCAWSFVLCVSQRMRPCKSVHASTACRAATGGRGADAVLEVVGSPSALRSAYDLVRPGGTISSVGCHTGVQAAAHAVHSGCCCCCCCKRAHAGTLGRVTQGSVTLTHLAMHSIGPECLCLYACRLALQPPASLSAPPTATTRTSR